MSNKKPMTIIQRVMAALNIGEEGNVLSFFNQLEKATNKDIVNTNANMAATELEHKQTLIELADELTDAKQELAEAYENVDVTKIKTIADQKAYIGTYLSRVNAAKAKIERIEASIKNEKDLYADYVKEEKAKIASLEERLTVFAGE